MKCWNWNSVKMNWCPSCWSYSFAAEWEEEEEESEDEDEIDPDAIMPVKKVKKPGQPKVRKEHLNVVFIGHVGEFSFFISWVWVINFFVSLYISYSALLWAWNESNFEWFFFFLTVHLSIHFRRVSLWDKKIYKKGC